MTDVTIALNDLRAGYGSMEILRGITLNARPGEVVLVVGHNGAGKSTIPKAVLGLANVYGGQVLLEDRDVGGLNTPRRVQAGIGYVPQSRGLFPGFTVRHNLELGGFTLSSGHVIHQRIEAAYALFPILKEKAGAVAGLLSGGQQRMLSLAMALMLQPRVLFIDEPSAGLAPKIVDETMERIREIPQAAGAPVILIEQNVAAGLRIADRAYVLKQGQVAGEFPAAELQARGAYWDLL